GHDRAEEISAPSDSSTTVTQVPSDADAADSKLDKDDKDKSPDKRKDTKKHPKKERKANFGALVSAEAHKLKSEGLNGKQKMGPWVSDQRKESDQKKPAGQNSENASASASANSDSRSSNPGGISSGQSDSHRK